MSDAGFAITVLLGPAAILALGTAAMRRAFLVTIVLAAPASVLATYHFLNEPEFIAALLLLWFVLPFVIAPLAGVVAGLAFGRPYALFAPALGAIAGAWLGIWLTSAVRATESLQECALMVAPIVVWMTCGAVLVGALAKRRT